MLISVPFSLSFLSEKVSKKEWTFHPQVKFQIYLYCRVTKNHSRIRKQFFSEYISAFNNLSYFKVYFHHYYGNQPSPFDFFDNFSHFFFFSDSLEGYVHLLSRVTNSKKKPWVSYFDCHIQTSENERVRAVCYAPEKQINLN